MKLVSVQESLTRAIVEQFSGGRVESLDVPLNEEFSMGDGWTCALLWYGTLREVYLAFGDSGKTLHAHNHPQTERIIMINGSTEIRVGQTETEAQQADPIVLAKGDSILFEADQFHQITSVGDQQAEILVVFEPRLSV